VLFKYQKGKRASVKWIRNTPTSSGQWQDLKFRITRAKVEGYLNGKPYLEDTLPAPASGKIAYGQKRTASWISMFIVSRQLHRS
jgi:hypothetical protein